MPLKQLIEAQARWARRRWPGHTGARAPSLEANLLVRLSRNVRCQFERGSGGELGSATKPGKMASLRSSSALSYNVFAPWIGRDLEPLGRALGIELADQTLEFERQFPHGLTSTPPNIDVALDNQQPRPLAIECKFTEPYGTKRAHPPLHDKYFEDRRHRWTDVGLPKCQTLARRLGRGVTFHRLGAGQLLKHLLGLAWTTRKSPRLLYLFYDSGCAEADEHDRELARFQGLLDPNIDFRILSYQRLFSDLRSGSEPMRGYHSYLQRRYLNSRDDG